MSWNHFPPNSCVTSSLMKKLMNDTRKKYLPLLLVFALPYLAQAQLDDEYFVADQLLQQQQYEKAAQKFEKLHRENPKTYIFLDKLTECLINLKEYEQAVSVTQEAVDQGYLRTQALIRLGEIYHTSDQK